MSGLLSIMLIVPLVAALACLFVGANQARWIALGATLVDLVLGGVLWANFEIGGPQWQFVEYAPIFGRFAWALAGLRAGPSRCDAGPGKRMRGRSRNARPPRKPTR